MACRWEFKAQHFDSVMLFKMGKFYEMFEMDAHVGAEVLGLTYMKANPDPPPSIARLKCMPITGICFLACTSPLNQGTACHLVLYASYRTFRTEAPQF